VPDVRLVVVGNVYTDKFLGRAAELGVEDLVISTGSVPSKAIPDYLAAAAVESHDVQGYGLGTASLESMGAGVAVVAAVRRDNFPGIELVSGRNCWLVPLGDVTALADALIEAISDPVRNTEVGERGRELVLKHFTMDVVLARHLEVLSAISGGL
jgi:glycosyltransferase involved in cell wall biosynthesis